MLLFCLVFSKPFLEVRAASKHCLNLLRCCHTLLQLSKQYSVPCIILPVASFVQLSWPFLSLIHPHPRATQTLPNLVCHSHHFSSPTSSTEDGLTLVVVTEEAEFPSISSIDQEIKRSLFNMSGPQSSLSLPLTTQTSLAWKITTDEACAGQKTSPPSHTHLNLLYSTLTRCIVRGCSTIHPLPPTSFLSNRFFHCVCGRQMKQVPRQRMSPLSHKCLS